jgi:predicted MFS family arabinose efflux permease
MAVAADGVAKSGSDPRRRLLTGIVCLAVAVAFADSSIVVLALPDLYSAFNTSIVGVSWVITAYNVVVAIGAFALVPVIGRLEVAHLTRLGLLLFFGASVGCAVAGALPVLIVFRCVQGAGAAMLLAGSLALLPALTGSRKRGVALWIAAGTFGAALGPALGGVLTQAFDWRAIFVFQAPVALIALIAAFESHVHPAAASGGSRRAAANLGLGLIFGALVGALFLAVLLVIDVWGLSPIGGAAVVSALPLAAVAAQRLRGQLSAGVSAAGGLLLLAGGLVALALLPAISPAIAIAGLALCGVGMGLAVPVLTEIAVRPEQGLVHDGTVTIGARHTGLVVALLIVAPVLSHDLQRGGRDAVLGGARVLLDADIPITQVVPIALDVRTTLDHTPRGKVPDLAAAFNKHGAMHDPALAAVRDSLGHTIKAAITRSFRPALALCALFAALALVPVAWLRRRRPG